FAFYGLLKYPYGLDYHPDALVHYRRRLNEQYLTIENLNRVYGTSYQDFSLVEPPRAFLAERLDNLVAYLDWTEFRQWGERFAAETIGSILTSRKISGIPLFYRITGYGLSVSRIPEKENNVRIEVRESAGSRSTYFEIRRYCRAVAGSGGPSYCPAFGGGVPANLSAGKVPAAEDEELMALAAMMFGLKGWNLPLAVEGDWSTAAPVRRDARIREEYYDPWSRIYRLLREVRFGEFRRVTEIVMIASRTVENLLTASRQAKTAPGLLFDGSLFDEIVDFGFQSGLQACLNWAEQAKGIMEEVGFDWDYGYTGPGVDMPANCRVLLLPSLDFFYPEDLDSLQAFTARGGALIFGPGVPRLDSRMRSNRGVSDFFSTAVEYNKIAESERTFAGKLIRLESPLNLGDLLKSLEVSLPFTRANPVFDLTLHASADGRRLLFAANKEATPQRTDIFFQGRLRFRDLLSGGNFSGEGKFRIELPPKMIGVWEVSA
ncbi:MAG TPA: beta-galactosidase, partial [Candidatus Glassbacteria bacterium]|nr:beta-galactosidase [Candidatus Glassbacteria bacterium]